MLQAVLQQLKHNRDPSLATLKQFLAIPSISTDPAYRDQVKQAAHFLAGLLQDIGLQTTLHPTPGHPILLAHTHPGSFPSTAGGTSGGGGETGGGGGGGGTPHLLFYGHYDVQPPDPLDLWHTPPFEPTVRDDAIYARGASDDKGQLLSFILALQAWKQAHGKLPIPISLVIEGEEETGSEHLSAFLQEHQQSLQADVVVISDTTMWNKDTVAITYALRGLLYFDVQLHNANRDLHSGMYGGTLANPCNILTHILGQLTDSQQRITVPHFYDDVAHVSETEKQQWEKLGFDEMQDCLAPVGVDTAFGEQGYTTLQRKWTRPACDINGLYGGYQGQGAKTVIPAFAGAKVSFRLAANQDPQKIAIAFEHWLQSFDTHGCKWKITPFGQAAPVAVPTDSPYITAAQQAIAAITGRPGVLVREGATIPVVADFKNILGIDSLLMGFGLPDDCIHSPNEKLNLDCFELGAQCHAALLDQLSQIQI